MAAAKSLTPAEIQNALAFIASGANPERNRCLFLMSVMAGCDFRPLDAQLLELELQREGWAPAAHRSRHAQSVGVPIS